MKASLGSSPGELLKFGRSSWSDSTVSRIITWKISYSSGVGWIFVEAGRRRREVPLRVVAAVNWVGKAGRTAVVTLAFRARLRARTSVISGRRTELRF